MTESRARATGPSVVQRTSLRWLVAVATLAAVTCFVAIAAAERSAAPVALAGALLMAAKGLGWLVYLRRHRAALRRHGYRW